ncbi:CPBP family glutamic-type intramembrane protease, partial [Undibacterium sp. RTI2.1]
DLDFSNLKLFAFAALIIAPILEELIFRLGLRNATYTLFFGPILVTIFSGSFFVTLGLTAVIVLMALVFEIQERYRTRNGKSGHNFYLGRQFIQAYPKVFWLYAFAFSFVHIANHSFDDASGFLVVFAVIPQLVLGIFLGYLRLRDGITSAMSLHFLNNLLAASLIFISPDS